MCHFQDNLGPENIGILYGLQVNVKDKDLKQSQMSAYIRAQFVVLPLATDVCALFSIIRFSIH